MFALFSKLDIYYWVKHANYKCYNSPGGPLLLKHVLNLVSGLLKLHLSVTCLGHWVAIVYLAWH